MKRNESSADQERLFNRNVLEVKSLAERVHDLDISIIQPIDYQRKFVKFKALEAIASRINVARSKSASIILMMGAHVLRCGVQNYLIDMMERNYISCIAVNGAAIIHDYELALIGATTESVANYIKRGEFGLWRETGQLNDIINAAYEGDSLAGLGETVGRHICDSSLPHRSKSILSKAFELKIPVTVHVGIGHDILHQHANFSGAATGSLSYNDFLIFTKMVQNLENGVIMNFGSAIMAPEVFLKALSMARNVAYQNGREICRFSTLVCDLHRLPKDFSKEPSKKKACYYFRPLKTMLIRTVADAGESFYVRGNHIDTVPSLWAELNRLERKHGKGSII